MCLGPLSGPGLRKNGFVELLGTMLAEAAIVDLRLVHLEALGHTLVAEGRHLLLHEIIDLLTLLAEEMDMGLQIAVVAAAVLVDCDHLGRIVLGEEAQRVIDGRSRERLDEGHQRLIHLLHRRMGGMGHEILHDGHPLLGRIDAMGLQSIIN